MRRYADTPEGMKVVHVEVFWRGTFNLEVPEDFEGGLPDLDVEYLDQIDATTAELYDWSEIT